MITRMIFTLSPLLALLFALPVYAQLGLPGAGADFSIVLNPAYPGPGESVQMTAQSSVINLTQSSMQWSANGKLIAQGIGITSANIVAGGLGAETAVTVNATAPDGTNVSAQAAIIPTEIDLLFESDSWVPPFYEGRALPSAGTDLILEAIPHFLNPDGTSVNPTSLIYTWKRNNEVIGNVSGLGKFSVAIPSPSLYENDIITVDVASSDGTLSGEASVYVPSTQPVLTLYEDHPLYGIRYPDARGDQTLISDSEMTFAAAPYFAEASSSNDPLLQYAWQVNGTSIASNSADPSEITIDAAKSEGLALIQLALTHATNFYLNASGSWNVTFSSAAAAAQSVFGQ